ncbi:universal stress protein [Gloeocapsopsis crepidinum LEGE 06123]|uniref:Universal stress protein n=2 Tax=Gloeocapsopsis crepidinum TaxID=693223 RepID=A0ABR9URI2_9CHRO|nr:universal stress protein [Gloeocapsopsis crepidinum LEGE 06123]
MNIKPMLARLQSATETNVIERMMLLAPAASQIQETTKSVDLVVGYNSSPNSQTALDLTLWIAHQTRLATQKQVTVHVVYVLEEHTQHRHCPISPTFDLSRLYSESISRELAHVANRGSRSNATQHSEMLLLQPRITSPDLFEQADLILWQAKSLAAEWRGSLVAHLRFGNVASELKAVVESENASLLFLGCNSANHLIVQQLGSNFPCAVLGIDFATGKVLAGVH